MKRKPNDKDPLFPGLQVPGPTDDLRRQVLERATQSMGSKPRRDRWVRLWESKTARLAWAALVLALVVGHLLLPAGGGGSPPRVRLAQDTPPARAGATAGRTDVGYRDELSVIADLPKLSLEGRPMTAPVVLDAASPTPPSKENAS
jgi:hypothetical protein